MVTGQPAPEMRVAHPRPASLKPRIATFGWLFDSMSTPHWGARPTAQAAHYFNSVGRKSRILKGINEATLAPIRLFCGTPPGPGGRPDRGSASRGGSGAPVSPGARASDRRYHPAWY